MRHTDPRIRQTLNQISQNLESANIATQTSLFNFSQEYISPCLSSLRVCLEASCQPCFNARDEQRKSHRNARRGRDTFAFDFYDYWDQDEAEWGNDEMDRLLAGNNGQPARSKGMNYGSRVARRKSMGPQVDTVSDPTVVPSSSIFGFLEQLPWKIGGRGRRYRPSAADLQENVGRARGEGQPLLDGDDERTRDHRQGRQGRDRSSTLTSRSTMNSLSSRGDLFPSEDEDDAVPLDDEFAMVLERRTTGNLSDDRSSKRARSQKAAGSEVSTKTASSKGSGVDRAGTPGSTGIEAEADVPSMADLKQEEEQVGKEEEAQIEKKRKAATQLARQRGLSSPDQALAISIYVRIT